MRPWQTPGPAGSRSAAPPGRRPSQPRRSAGHRRPNGDKRLDAAVLVLIVALRERDALEQQAGAAIRTMLAEGLAIAEIVTWTDGQTTTNEASRLANLQPEEDPS